MEVTELVLSRLDDEFRTTSEIAARCGLHASRVAAPLGTLRRDGLAEFRQAPRAVSLWRRVSAPDENWATWAG
jgi:DNA-binding IclR family transcriptional regulator